MHHESLLLNLAVCLAAALLCGWGAARLHFSPIVGYLLAGILCGPFTPGWVANPEIAEQLADIGVILLMFGVGLHFNFHELLAVRAVAVPGAIVQSVVATGLVMGAGHLTGTNRWWWDWPFRSPAPRCWRGCLPTIIGSPARKGSWRWAGWW